MRNKRYLVTYGPVWLLLFCLAACSKVPDGILSEKKMQQVVKDMMIAQSMTSADYKSYPDNQSKQALYEGVFRKHGITQAEYDSSLVWYGRNLDIYMKVYERVLADVDKDIKALGDVQADAGPVSNSDSVNIWPRRPYVTLQPEALFNGVIFDSQPETSYSSGSIFALGMRVWGLRNGMHAWPEVRLSADQGDTIVTVNEQITRDGYREIWLKTVPTKRVKRVYGYIRLNDTTSDYYKIYIDSISLIKYNYGSELLKHAVDSLALDTAAVSPLKDSIR